MSIEKRGNRWRARYRGPDHKERNRSFDRKLDAERWLADQRTKIDRAEWIDPAAMRVPFETVAREWMTSNLHLKPKTVEGYRRLLEGRILPRFERVAIGKVAVLLPEWVGELARSGLSPSQVRQTVYLLSSICQYAIRTGRLLANPVTGIKLPKLASTKERRFLDHHEVAVLADAAGEYGTFVRTLAYTGMRWGEATALRVRDVNVPRRRLDIRQALSDVNGHLIEGTPKTHQGRTVPLPAALLADLVELVDNRQRDALVFTAPDGGPMRAGNFRQRVWNPAIEVAGLGGLTPHGLRHTAASLYIAAGAPPKVVQRILGHASITITMDLYGHLYPDEMDTWADRLNEAATASGVWPECGQNADPEASSAGEDEASAS